MQENFNALRLEAFHAPSALFGTYKEAKLGWRTLLRQAARVGWSDALQSATMKSLREPSEEIAIGVLRGDIEKHRRMETHWWLHFIGQTRPFGPLLEKLPYERDWQLIIEGTEYLWYTLGLILPRPDSFPKRLGGPIYLNDPDFQEKIRAVFSAILSWLPEIMHLQRRFSLAETPHFQFLHPLSWATGFVWYAGFCCPNFPIVDLDDVYRIGDGDIVRFLLNVNVIKEVDGRFRLADS
jgi:hypothetical protein